MKKYPEEFFENMKFRVHKLDQGVDLMEQFPSLLDYKEFNISHLHWNKATMTFDRDMLLKYIFYCYDESLRWEFPDMKTRKEFCLKLAGYRTKDESIKELLVSNELKQVNEMILTFFKILNNRKHRRRIQALELLDQFDRIIMAKFDPDLEDDKLLKSAAIKTKLMDDTIKLDTILDAIEEGFFGSEKEAKEITSVKKQRTTPESRAKNE